MLELLRTGAPGPLAAAETALATLAAERRGVARLLAFTPRELRLELAACLAWFVAAAEVRATARNKLASRRLLQRLGDEAGEACSGAPETVLGAALSLAARRRALVPEPFAAHTEALLHELEVGTFETREALLRHLAGAAQPPGRVLLRALRLESERRVALVDYACRAAWMLARWARVPTDLEAGLLFVPAEDVAAHGVALADLRDRRDGPSTTALLADLGLWAREHLDLAWELPGDLGPLRGRLASAGLRVLEARLRAFERRGYATLARPPAAGWFPVGLGVTLGLAWRGAPRRRS